MAGDDGDAVAAPTPPWQRRAKRVLLHHGLASEDAAVERVAEALVDAHVDGAEMALDGRALWNRHHVMPVEHHATVKPALRSAGSTPTVLFNDLLAAWQADARPTDRTILEFTRAMRRLTEHVGHQDATRLTRDDITGFRDAMLDRCSAKTVFNILACVRATLNVGVRAGKIDSNPAAGVAVKVKANGRRLPFTDAEASMILTAARGQSGGRRWVPWLLAYTGARLEEICQAVASDIRQEGGITYLDINEDDLGKQIKNAGSARKVPLHRALIEEGYLEFVRSMGSGPLFPDFKPDRFGRRGGTATKVLGRALRKLKIIDPRKVAGHSWRHRFKDLCRGAGIEKAVHDALTGHASQDVGDGYGLGYPLPTLAAAIEKLPAPL